MRKALFLTLLLVPLAVPAKAQPGLQIPNLSGPAGSLLVVPILITPTPDLSALELTVRLPQQLSLFDSPLRRGDALADHSFSQSAVGGDVQIVVFSTSLARFAANGGSVVQLLLNVSPQAANGARLPLQILNAVGSSVAGEAVALDTVDGEITVSGQVSAPIDGQNRLIFPQVANGSFAGGSFGITTIAVNLTSAPATARIRFVQSDGSPFEIALANGMSGSEFVLNLPPEGSAFVESSGTGALGQGYAVLDASAPVGGSLLFTLRNPAGLRFTEAGVSDSPLGLGFVIPVGYEQNSVDTGIAVANFGTDATITLTLKGTDGQVLETVQLPLPAGQHTAQFASQFFAFIAQQTTFEGSIEVSSDQPVSVISLRQFAGGLLTTLPVVPLTP